MQPLTDTPRTSGPSPGLPPVPVPVPPARGDAFEAR